MAKVEGNFGLEWCAVYLYDDGATEELPAEFDPAAGLAFATESTLILRGIPEHEGDVTLGVAFNEEIDSGSAPILLGTGQFLAPKGRILIRTSSWERPFQMAVDPGTYEYSVFADDEAWPRRLVVTFTLANGPGNAHVAR